MTHIESVIQDYQRTFGEAATVIAQAPGRANLIGEHTDYNEGYVLPFAIDRIVCVAAGPGKRDCLTVNSEVIGETATFPCRVTEPADEQPWQNYVRGVVAGLRLRGVAVSATNLWIGGDLSIGSGLSSSAALCVATALAFAQLTGAELHPMDVVQLVQEAERDFVGTPCGIMDPHVSLFGKADHAVLLDCRNKTHKYVPLHLPTAELLILPSGVQHALSRDAYGERVRECREVVATLRTIDPSIQALRDVTDTLLREHQTRLDPTLAKRALHVVSENARVLDVVDDLRTGRVEHIGQVLSVSHASLRDHYEVSCPEIEALISLLTADDGVFGARMIGGGFGGSVLALTRKGTAKRMNEQFARRNVDKPQADRRIPSGHALSTEAHIIHPADGAYARRL